MQGSVCIDGIRTAAAVLAGGVGKVVRLVHSDHLPRNAHKELQDTADVGKMSMKPTTIRQNLNDGRLMPVRYIVSG